MRGEEVKCPDIELDVLQSIEDVTARVNAAVLPGASLADAREGPPRRDEHDRAGVVRSDRPAERRDSALSRRSLPPVPPQEIHGRAAGVSPEDSAASFGGDPDNFEYPRCDLNMCLFRAYENGGPAKIRDYLTWSRAGVADGELTFVSGHPGKTDRQDTVANLKFLRDDSIPFLLEILRRREVLLSVYSQRSQENARRTKERLLGIQNSRKAQVGRLGGLKTRS